AGSVFRNPQDYFAWQLIDDIYLRGLQIGGARVSDKHPNFIVNEDHATAKDFIQITEQIKQSVKNQYQLDLIMEVEKFNCR
ncbi:MAG: UDP-N-acetylenolpyruvoylglucosamine reductase, partial [Erysipelotrichaceae bacterium]